MIRRRIYHGQIKSVSAMQFPFSLVDELWGQNNNSIRLWNAGRTNAGNTRDKLAVQLPAKITQQYEPEKTMVAGSRRLKKPSFRKIQNSKEWHDMTHDERMKQLDEALVRLEEVHKRMPYLKKIKG